MLASAKQRGSVLLGALIGLGIMVTIGFFMAQRFNSLLKVELDLEDRQDRQDWAVALSERISCERVMKPYTVTNRCPKGTKRTVILHGSAALPASGPNGSQLLGGTYYLKAECGDDDLQVHVASYANGKFRTDPLSKNLLDFANPTTQVSDKNGGVPICASYFGQGKPHVQMVTMSIATLQAKGASYTGGGGAAENVGVTCDSHLGMLGLTDDLPLIGYWRNGGPSGSPTTLSAFGRYYHDFYQGWYAAQSKGGNMQPTWFMAPQGRAHGASMCSRICNWFYEARAGKMVKCDPTRPATPLGTMTVDQTTGQADCLCLR